MTPNKQLAGRSVLNWLGLGILVIVTVGIILLSRGPTEPDEPSETTPLRALSRDHSTPVSADVSSPLTAAVHSPQPSPGVLPDSRLPALVPVPDTTSAPTPSGSLLPPPVPGADLQFSVLHSNDTWGYVLPCG